MKDEEFLTPWNSHDGLKRYDSLFPLLPDFVAHSTVGGKLLPEIGLPKNAQYLSKKILSALIAHQMQIGMSYAEKKYSRPATQSRWLGLTNRIDEIFSEGRNAFGWYISAGLDCPKKENTFQDLSMQFFFRNLAAFDAAKRLSELGYLCETATILRSSLEQFAFSAHLWRLIGSEEIERISRKDSFATFKKLAPSSGLLYGLLSKYAHFEYDHHTHFFARSNKIVTTIRQGSVLRAYATHLLLITMICIAKYVLLVSQEQLGYASNEVQKLESFINNVDLYSDDVCTIFSQDVVFAQLDILISSMIRK